MPRIKLTKAIEPFGLASLNEKDRLELIKPITKHILLPSQAIACSLPDNIFPTIRYKLGNQNGNQARFQPVLDNKGNPIGMYDDNTTPKWALLWSHRITVQTKSGWQCAHVWAESRNVHYYTRISNLLLIPECFASMTDKDGPLVNYLKWHAKEKYALEPSSPAKISKPFGYDEIDWKYLDEITNVTGYINARFKNLRNRRVRFMKEQLKLDSLV